MTPTMGYMDNNDVNLKRSPVFLPGIDLTLWLAIITSVVLSLSLCVGVILAV